MILLGNSFPMSLIRRCVTIQPASLEELRARIRSGEPVHSFWGHANTLTHAEAITGCPLKPESDRPALTLSPEAFPVYAGHTFQECWVISPEYESGFRPRIGEEIDASRIEGWQVLRIHWPAEASTDDSRQYH